MPNIIIAGIYMPFAIITVIVLLEVLLRNIANKGNCLFMSLCLLVIGWYTSNIIGVLTDSVNAARFLWGFMLIFVCFIPPVLLLFVLDFYHVPIGHAAKFTPLIFVIPFINTIIAFTSRYHSLMYARLDIVSLSPTQEIARVWGPWFWVHSAYCYIISIAIICLILVQHFRMPKFYRLPSTLMMVGVSFSLISNVITLLQVLPITFDPTLIGTSLALILFNFAIINNDRSKFIRYSFGKVFDYLNIYIIIMDESNRVVHVNRPALDWLSSYGITSRSSSLNQIIETLAGKGVIQKELGSNEGTDIYFPTDTLPVILNMHVQKMTDKHGDIIGSAAIFTDVTQNRLLLNRLEKKAGIDSLTGLANRMAYEGALIRLDAPEHLPLSVIMCDVNELKAVNDNLGHKYGDMMLRTIAEVFEAACSKQGFVARTGGDEFVFLLRRTSQDEAAAFMKKTRELLLSRANLPFTLSVALGAATKYFADEEISKVIDLADSRMYENKRFIKSHGNSVG